MSEAVWDLLDQFSHQLDVIEQLQLWLYGVNLPCWVTLELLIPKTMRFNKMFFALSHKFWSSLLVAIDSGAIFGTCKWVVAITKI